MSRGEIRAVLRRAAIRATHAAMLRSWLPVAHLTPEAMTAALHDCDVQEVEQIVARAKARRRA